LQFLQILVGAVLEIDEAIARGAFGSPTIYLNKTDMYFGNDRLPLVRDALMRTKK